MFRLVAALGLPTLLLLAIEGALRGSGYGYPTPFLVVPDSKPHQLIDNYKFFWRFFPPALARSPQPIAVPRVKPPSFRRIVVMGGSAAMGDPEPAYGMPRVLQALLELRFPDTQFEIINASVTAINSHVVLSIARDCRILDADAWLIYLGNNEVAGPFGAGTVFGGHQLPRWRIRAGLELKRSRIGQFIADSAFPPAAHVPRSWGGMKMFLDQQIRHTDPRLERVYRNFQANLSDILEMARHSETPVVLATVVSNVRDCAPFASLHPAGWSAPLSTAWQKTYDQGCTHQARGRHAEALTQFQAAASIDAGYAELQYRMGQCQLALGQIPQAAERFRRARDYDTLRFRADTRINQMVREVAAKHTIPTLSLVDAEAEFAARAEDTLVGDQYLLEHVHFRFEGNYLLAKLFANELRATLRLPGRNDRATPAVGPDGWPTLDACQRRLGLTLYHRLLLAREMKSRFSSPPFTNQLGHDQRAAYWEARIERLSELLGKVSPDDDIARIETLLQEYPDDWLLRRQFSLLLESANQLEASAEQLRFVVAQLPHHAEAHFLLGKLLNRQKNWRAAVACLNAALAIRPAYARVHNSLGIAYSHLDQLSRSYGHFARAVALQPSFAEAHYNWGLVLAHQNDLEAAVKKFEDAVAADDRYLPARLKLGKHYIEVQQHELAEPHYRAVAQQRPQDAMARLNLGLLYMKLNRADEAVQHLRHAVRLAPNDRVAAQALHAARNKLSGP